MTVRRKSAGSDGSASGKTSTINDIARLSGVSKKTVSRIINKSPLVKPDTRERVEALMREVGYSPDPMARALAFRRSFLIGMVYDNPTAQYIVNMQYGALDALRDSGFELVVHPCDSRSPGYIDGVRRFVQQQKLHGVMLVPRVSEDQALADMLEEIGCRYVRIASVSMDEPSRMVVTHDRNGAAEVAEYLLAMGHTDIALVTGQDRGLHHFAWWVDDYYTFLPDGTAWFTDFNNFLIRRVLADGTIESMVGSLDPLFPGDGPFGGITPVGAEGLDWLLNHPTNLLLQPDGNILVVAWHNHKLLTVDPTSGFVKVMCGGGAGFAGDGMVAAPSTLFKQVNDATFDEAGNIYVLDQQNERIRMIAAADSIITTIAGDGTPGYSGDGGPALEAQFSWARGSNPNPSGGILYHDGKLYISDTEANVIRMMDLADGTIHGFAGTGEKGDGGDDGPALDAKLSAPRDLEIGPDGDLYFADTDNGKVRAIDLEAGIIRTVVGTGELGIDEEDGLLATETRLRRPFGVAFAALLVLSRFVI